MRSSELDHDIADPPPDEWSAGGGGTAYRSIGGSITHLVPTPNEREQGPVPEKLRWAGNHESKVPRGPVQQKNGQQQAIQRAKGDNGHPNRHNKLLHALHQNATSRWHDAESHLLAAPPTRWWRLQGRACMTPVARRCFKPCVALRKPTNGGCQVAPSP